MIFSCQNLGLVGVTLYLPPREDVLPSKTTVTEFLMKMNDLLIHNDTLGEIKVQSGLFLPLSAGEDGEYFQWTGLGPLQQLNLEVVESDLQTSGSHSRCQFLLDPRSVCFGTES